MAQPVEDRIQALRRGSLVPIALALCTAPLLAYLVASVLMTGAQTDQTWYLYAAQRLMSGAQLYGPQVTDTNPPLVLWFSLLPVLVSQWLQITPRLALKLIVLLMVLGSTWWSASILRAATILKAQPAVLLLLIYAILLMNNGIVARDFGQREHLMFLLSLPYVLAAASGAAAQLGTAELIALGIAAGIGVCFKPQQALVFAGLEVALALYTRSLKRAIRPEFLALVLTCCVYVLAIRGIAPLYLSDTMPLLLNTYWAFGENSALSLATAWTKFNLLLFAAVLAYVFLRHKLRTPAVSLALLASGLMASVAYDIQHSGLFYQEFPQRAFVGMAICWLLVDLFSSRIQKVLGTPDLRIALATCALLFLAAMPVTYLFLRHHNRQIAADPLELALAQYPAQTPIYIFSTDLRESFPLVLDRKLIWGSRFAHLWMMPAIIQNQLGRRSTGPFKALSPQTVAMLAARQRAESAEDLERWKPVAVVVDRCSSSHPCMGLKQYNLDLLPWFLESPRFAEDWSHYHLQSLNSDFSIYTRDH